MAASTSTIVKNVSGFNRTFSFLPPFGKNLDNNETYEVLGDIYVELAKSRRNLQAFQRSVDSEALQILQVPGSPGEGGADYGPAVQTLQDLRDVSELDRFDKQIRLAEDTAIVYRFDAEGVGVDNGTSIVEPTVGTGRWFISGAAETFTASVHTTTDHTDLPGVGTNWKTSVRVATTGNITLSGLQSIDDVSVIADDRVLARAQTIESENGIYSAATGAWARTTDADTGGSLLQATVTAQEGTLFEDQTFLNTTNAPITLGVSDIIFESYAVRSFPSAQDKDQTPTATVGDNASTGVVINSAPVEDSFPAVLINGNQVALGDGVKTKDCYFSVDGGTTPRAIVDITGGDELFWNGVIAEFDLATSDRIDFNYNAGSGHITGSTTDTYTATDGQTIFNLSDAYEAGSFVMVTINNVVYDEGTSYTVSGTVLTWLDVPFALTAGNVVRVTYNEVGIAEEFFVPTAAQTIFTLANSYISGGFTALTVNGVLYDQGTEYLISGTTLTWLGLFPLAPADSLCIRYKFA